MQKTEERGGLQYKACRHLTNTASWLIIHIVNYVETTYCFLDSTVRGVATNSDGAIGTNDVNCGAWDEK